ncbi:Holliday junction branch migration protein RuvA [Gammaproteobacteria bacterium LSUCC0057]|uniref:Holliday junction branch migration complex subunit RuvA n=1 Tax=Gammaproteobacteria bacterium LSUCC0057 TaxID=2559237 RepID=A0A4Y8UJR6_9GAMM|nr:Holliday junction branch migration protein RuvA [Gammaproteobacteria bacterium LSUCC0057]
MIARISGTLIAAEGGEIVVDVGGVGYELQVSLNTFFALPPLGAQVALLCHFVVREDAQLLYGFLDSAERALFRLLIKVNGVGPKMALAILSGMSVVELQRAVAGDDIARLTKLPGVGKKTAERLLIELRDKVDLSALGGAIDSAAATGSAADEAAAALAALGYRPADADKMIAKLNSAEMTTEELVKAALRNL